MSRTPDEQSLASRIGAHKSWAFTPDRAARTAPARAALHARFEREVDPDGILTAAERVKRAENARKAYYLSLALKSAKARRARAVVSEGEAAEAELARGGHDAI